MRARSVGTGDDRGVDVEIADTRSGLGDHRHLDRPDEVVVRLAGALAHGVGELAHERLVKALEALEVGLGHVHDEVIRHDGAAHAERATGVELADEPASDLDGL